MGPRSQAHRLVDVLGHPKSPVPSVSIGVHPWLNSFPSALIRLNSCFYSCGFVSIRVHSWLNCVSFRTAVPSANFNRSSSSDSRFFVACPGAPVSGIASRCIRLQGACVPLKSPPKTPCYKSSVRTRCLPPRPSARCSDETIPVCHARST